MRNLIIKKLGGYTADEMVKMEISLSIKYTQESLNVLKILQNLRAKALMLEVELQRAKNVQ